jgi:hypothetical protein
MRSDDGNICQSFKLLTQIPSLQKEVTIRKLSKIIVIGTVIIKTTKDNSKYMFSCYPNKYFKYSFDNNGNIKILQLYGPS